MWLALLLVLFSLSTSEAFVADIAILTPEEQQHTRDLVELSRAAQRKLDDARQASEKYREALAKKYKLAYKGDSAMSLNCETRWLPDDYRALLYECAIQ